MVANNRNNNKSNWTWDGSTYYTDDCYSAVIDDDHILNVCLTLRRYKCDNVHDRDAVFADDDVLSYINLY